METLQSVEVAWSAEFQEALMAYGKYENLYPEVTRVYESRERTTNMALLLGDVEVKEWAAGTTRDVDHFAATSYEVGVRRFALTAGVPKTYLDYDGIGIVADKVGDIPAAIPEHYAQLVWEALIAGFSTACWDGQYMFAAAHPYARDEVSSTTFSNYLPEALSAPSFEKAYARLGSIMRIGSKSPFNRRTKGSVKLFCGPTLAGLAREIVRPNSSGAAYNRNADLAEVIEVGALAAYPTYWFLWDGSLNHKPIFLKVNRRMDDIVILDQPRDPNVFWQDEVIVGSVGEHELAYFHPYCIIGAHP